MQRRKVHSRLHLNSTIIYHKFTYYVKYSSLLLVYKWILLIWGIHFQECVSLVDPLHCSSLQETDTQR